MDTEGKNITGRGHTSDLLVGVLFLLLAAFIVYEATGMLHRGKYLVDSPGFIPLLMGISMSVLSIILITQMLINKAYLNFSGWLRDTLKSEDFKRWFTVFIITTIYFLFIGRISFYYLTFAYLMAMFLYFRSTKIWFMILVAAGVSAMMHFVFYLGFRMPLP